MKILALVLLFVASIASASEPTVFDQDRHAILAMAGEFEVSFEFDETVSLRTGYQLKPPQRTSATEWVQVIEDTGKHIVLQHLLVLGDKHWVVKHWRQDWSYEAPLVWEFEGHQHFEVHEYSADETRGTWQQAVFEVEDSPRYASIGRWRHVGKVSQWTSAETWRPLPRREYTKRSDYDVLLGINRHTITPEGWVHEQDNTKFDTTDSAGEPFLAREIGRNVYKRTTAYDFSAGQEYWKKTADFWASVRQDWQEALSTHSQVEIARDVDGKPVVESLFALADKGGGKKARREAHEIIQKAVVFASTDVAESDNDFFAPRAPPR
jgi:hypothetical protein